MIKIIIRSLDLFFSSVGIIICLPIILTSCVIIFLQDFNFHDRLKFELWQSQFDIIILRQFWINQAYKKNFLGKNFR